MKFRRAAITLSDIGKKILLAAVLLLLTFCLWATSSPYIRQYNESYTVDLASDSYLSHTTGSTYKEQADVSGLRNNGYYYRCQELGVVGITGIRQADSSVDDVKVKVPQTNGTSKEYNVGRYSGVGDVTITVTLLSGEWFYSLNGSVYKRPFGLDVFARGRVIPKSGTATDADIPGYSLHMGNQAYQHEGEADGVVSKTLPASTLAGYDFIWWDLVLVMDPVVDTQTDTVTYNGVEYRMLPSNTTYKVDLQITISCTDGGSATFPFHLEGFYKTDAVSSGSTSGLMGILSVNPVANSFRLDGATGLLATRDTPSPVATYDFTTTSKGSADTTNKVYLFISSLSSAYNTGDHFALHHVKDPQGIYVTPLEFEVIMESRTTERGDGLYQTGTPASSYYRPLPHARNQVLPDAPEEPEAPGEDATEDDLALYEAELEAYADELASWQASVAPYSAYTADRFVIFSGADRFNVGGSSTNAKIPSNAMEIYGAVTRQKPTTYYTRWQDSGNIYIRMTGKDIDGNNVDLNSLPPGQYTEDIYVHVIMF